MKPCALIPLLLAILSGGCAWRTQRADHILGPAWYRYAGNSEQLALGCETLHFPLLLEGGRQWGVTIGGSARVALVAASSSASPDGATISIPGTNQTAAGPTGWLIHPQPGAWRWSPLYLKVPLGQTPLFIRRSVVGGHGGIGIEERSVSLGYSSVTATTPMQEGVYQLDFDSRRPMAATAVVAPAREAVGTGPESRADRSKEQP